MAEIELPTTESAREPQKSPPRPHKLPWQNWFRPLISVLALGLIGLWIFLWIASARENHLALGQTTWVPILPFLAGDFVVHIDHVARLQAAGIDPYHRPGDWVCGLYPYPPMIGRLFEWVAWFDTRTASRVWLTALGMILAVGGLAAWRTRKELGLDPIPLALIVALVVFSTPALFAMERGQCDPLIILPMIAAAWLLRRQNAWAEVLAGGLLGLTAWVKYYPGLSVVALLALGRRKGLAAFVAVAGLIGIVDYDGFRESIEHGKQTMIAMTGPNRAVHEVKHSIVENWDLMGFVSNTWLVKIPGVIAAAMLLLPAVFLVSRRVARSADPGAVLLPYLLWLTAIATFGLPYSIDYNLTTLPIATLAVWDRRDRWWIHLAIVASLLWSQPFWLPIHGQIMLCLKLGAIYAVGASIASRASGVAAQARPMGQAHLFRPTFARIVRPNRVVSGETAPDSRPS